MIFTIRDPSYTIADLGFDKTITKISSSLSIADTTPELANVFTSGVAPKSLISGELISTLEQLTGVLFTGKTGFNNTQIGYRLGIDVSDGLAKFYIGNTTDYINWDGTTLTIVGGVSIDLLDIGGADATSFHVDVDGNLWLGAATYAAAPFTVSSAGALTATSGAIGGFTIDTDNIRDVANSFGLASTVSGGDDVRFWAGDTYVNRATADFRVTEAGAVTGSSITITGGSVAASILSGLVPLANENVAAQGWTYSGAWSSTDNNTAAWASGTLTTAAGTAYSITGSNTGNMAAKTYVYLDIGVSITAFQTTTTAATAVGSGKVLVAVAQNNTDSSGKVWLQVFGGTGGVFLAVDNLAANSSSTNEFISNTAQIANLVVTNAKINDLSVAKLTSGTSTSKTYTLATAGAGDAYFNAGKTDFDNTVSGFILGIDDSDSDTPKFYIGDSSNYLNWDGDTLTIRGTLDADSPTVVNLTAGENLTAGQAICTKLTYSADFEVWEVCGECFG